MLVECWLGLVRVCSQPDGRTAAEVDVDLLEIAWTGSWIRVELDWLGLNQPAGDPGFLLPKPEILDPQETSGCLGVRRCNNWVITELFQERVLYTDSGLISPSSRGLLKLLKRFCVSSHWSCGRARGAAAAAEVRAELE